MIFGLLSLLFIYFQKNTLLCSESTDINILILLLAKFIYPSEKAPINLSL